ncbi:MAG: pyridoxamine 5'-phosphate oxidase family protein [Thermomicrobiales bacterium]|nr:MAG: pyridoxamine 5'-phosphate oxidase family protein [Thermomicrobiales bacterium]
MGRTFDTIDARLEAWIAKQPLFFVATAPSGVDGHVNVSPKGGNGLLQVLNPSEVSYLDLVGSGAETIAHLRQNGRIVIMFCAFDGAPKVIRLHGKGRVIVQGHPEFEERIAKFDPSAETMLVSRSIIVIDVERSADSCGFMVPRMRLVDERDQLVRWAEKQQERNGDCWKESYIQANNLKSIDGLRALDGDGLLPDTLAQFSSEGKAL